jgi:hypothetical protein
MAGERQFAARGEDPNLRRVRDVGGRQHEGGLRQIELGRDRLHLPGRQSLGVQDDGQRIADELRAGEHVDGLKLQAHLARPPADRRFPDRSADLRLPDSICSGNQACK